MSGFKSDYYKRDIFKRLFFKIFLNRKRYEEKDLEESYAFREDYLNQRYCYYHGYWCNERYFCDIKDKVFESFKFPKLDKKNSGIADKIMNTDSVSIHVRRGDYLKVQNSMFQGICTKQYYEKAIEVIHGKIEKPVFYVFSDDIYWCKEKFTHDNFEFIDWNKGLNSFRDMQLMSLCKNNIIANSTFSWWGAWLNSNPKKIVCAPIKFRNITKPVIGDCPNDWFRIGPS